MVVEMRNLGTNIGVIYEGYLLKYSLRHLEFGGIQSSKIIQDYIDKENLFDFKDYQILPIY